MGNYAEAAGRLFGIAIAGLVVAILTFYAIIGLDYTLVATCDAHIFPPWLKYALGAVLGACTTAFFHKRSCAVSKKTAT